MSAAAVPGAGHELALPKGVAEVVDSTSCAAQSASAFRRAVKSVGVCAIAVVFLMGLLHWPLGLIDDEHSRSAVLSALFLVGLLMVIVEEHVDVNKAAIMLLVSSAMWTFIAVSYHSQESHVGLVESWHNGTEQWTVSYHLNESNVGDEELLQSSTVHEGIDPESDVDHEELQQNEPEHRGHEEFQRELDRALKDVGSIILFLLPAMGVVESIDHFDGFAVVTQAIHRGIGGKKTLLIPALGLITFFLSAIIDNLTATIVALKILRHMAGDDRHLRHLVGGLVVIAANAGGAWSPVGDVTTTMLWIQGKISVTQTIAWLFLPSLMAAVVPMLGLWFQVSRAEMAREGGDVETADAESDAPHIEITRSKVLVLTLGLVCIFMVPVLKMTTGIPPYVGMLMALGIIWMVTDTRAFKRLAKPVSAAPTAGAEGNGDATPHTPKEEHYGDEGVIDALHKMDLTGMLFFAGVLLAVGALNTAGILEDYAAFLVRLCNGSTVLICSLLGVSSAVVDNVPLVEASIHMFADTPHDDPLWQLVALAAGTGGSILSVGSIAGVTLMTMEGVGYLWYCRRVSLWAALGFACGIATYQLERLLFA